MVEGVRRGAAATRARRSASRRCRFGCVQSRSKRRSRSRPDGTLPRPTSPAWLFARPIAHRGLHDAGPPASHRERAAWRSRAPSCGELCGRVRRPTLARTARRWWSTTSGPGASDGVRRAPSSEHRRGIELVGLDRIIATASTASLRFSEPSSTSSPRRTCRSCARSRAEFDGDTRLADRVWPRSPAAYVGSARLQELRSRGRRCICALRRSRRSSRRARSGSSPRHRLRRSLLGPRARLRAAETRHGDLRVHVAARRVPTSCRWSVRRSAARDADPA